MTSRQSPIVKRFRAAARQRRDDDLVLLDGPHLIGEALDAGVPVEVAVFAGDLAEGRLAALAGRCADAGAQVVTAPAGLIGSMTPVRQASGVVALARRGPATLAVVLGATPPQLVVVLDHVQDPGNVGAVIRVAEACGATGIVVTPGTADPFSWKALRGSMGSALRVPVAHAPSLDGACEATRRAGLRLVATAPRGGIPLERADLVQPCAILMGGEGAGLPQPALDAADDLVTIRMQPPVESLNISIAAALVLYEASRQRSHVAV